jgi:hypothetical protein
MRSAIPNYSKRVAFLQAALAKVFGGKSRRTKKSAAAVSLLHLWGPEEKVAFKDLQAAIMESMTLTFSDPDTRICVLKDSPDRSYAGLVTHIHEEQLDLPMEEQDHHSLLRFCQASSKAHNSNGQYQRRKVSLSSTQYPRLATCGYGMTSSRFCLTILTSHTFTILPLQTLHSRVMLYSSYNAGHSRC